MNEKQLLRISIITAIIGLITLAIIPDLPSQETYATLVWAEENRGLLEYTQTTWIQTKQPIILSTPQCVKVDGIYQEGTIRNALLQPQITKQEGCV